MALRAYADGVLFGEKFGTDDPQVLALHGWGRRGSDFAPVLRDIPGIAIDLPGFGASPIPQELLGAREYASLITPVLDNFERPPVLVGHSFGGRVAVCLASAHPDKVGALVLTGVPLLRLNPPQKPKPGYRMARWMANKGLISAARMEAMRRRRGSADYRNARGIMRDILVKVVGESYESELRELKRPVVMVWGDSDSDVPVSVAEKARGILLDNGSTVDLRVLPGVGHHTPIQAPNEIADAIATALKL